MKRIEGHMYTTNPDYLSRRYNEMDDQAVIYTG